MSTTVTISTDDPDTLDDLYAWLKGDVHLVRQAEVRLRTPGTGDGTMSALAVIDVIVSNAIALAALTVAYANWRRSRAEPREQAPVFRFAHQEVTVYLQGVDQEELATLGGILGNSDPATDGVG